MKSDTKVYTLFLFNNFLDDPFFFQLEGDYTRFQNIVINATDEETAGVDTETLDNLCEELTKLVYKDGGALRVKKLPRPTKDWTFFVYCGFSP